MHAPGSVMFPQCEHGDVLRVGQSQVVEKWLVGAGYRPAGPVEGETQLVVQGEFGMAVHRGKCYRTPQKKVVHNLIVVHDGRCSRAFPQLARSHPSWTRCTAQKHSPPAQAAMATPPPPMDPWNSP